jgi:hypothetical protein
MKTLVNGLGAMSLLIGPVFAAAPESGQPQGQVVQGEEARATHAPSITVLSQVATDGPPFAIVGSFNSNDAPPVTVLQPVQASGVEAVAGDGNTLQPNLFFSTPNSADVEKQMQQMRERLANPDQRAQLLAEQRASIQRQYPDAELVLRIDAATKEKLFDALADQQLRQMDELYNRAPATRTYLDTYSQAQRETQRLDALREVLGDQGLERFQNYKATLGERFQIRSLTSRLAPGSELKPDQQEQLIALMHEQNQRQYDVLRSPRRFMLSSNGKLPSREEMQRQSTLESIALNEESLRNMQASNRELSQRAAAFLTPDQLAAFSQMNADNERQQRQWIASARAQVGLDPTMSAREAAEANAPLETRKPIEGDVQLEISLVVNRGAPTVVNRTIRNGEVVTIEAGEGLVVEATPTLYDDHWLDVKMAYYEQERTGKRLLQSGASFGTLMRMPNGQQGHRSHNESVVTGSSKGYAIETEVSATPL